MKTKQLQIVTFEQAKRLKELGFKWETKEHYCGAFMDLHVGQKLDRNSDPLRSNCSAPAVALALKWFRDEKKYYAGVMPHSSEMSYYGLTGSSDTTERYDTYEATESALLDELLTILEKEKEQ